MSPYRFSYLLKGVPFTRVKTTRNVICGAVIAGSFVVPFTGCDVDFEDSGELPTVDVEGGELPEVDVEGPDVDVDSTEVEVPTLDVDIPEESDD